MKKKHDGDQLGSFFDQQIACVSAVILLSVAALQSNINECFASCDSLFPNYPDCVRQKFCDLVERCPILEKYQKTLAFLGKTIFDKRKLPFQDVNILIELRNELVHFHPEWHDEQERHEKIGKKLKDKFKLSPFISDNSSIFPVRFVSYDCTSWTLRSSYNFMNDFNGLVGFPNKFDSLAVFIEKGPEGHLAF